MQRRLAAILAADVAGYSRMMGADEEGTLAALKVARGLVDPTIDRHRGRIVKTTGDGLLVEFASAVDAVRCAVAVQRGMAERNAEVPLDLSINFRIGIHVGDIIFDSGDIFGDGVNIAARLESIAEPGSVCISDDAQRQVRGKIDSAFFDMGPQILRNIAEPMRAWRVDSAVPAAPAPVRKSEMSTLALPDKPSIAVLPFQNMSGDPEQEYFADGMVEDIITALSWVKWFFIIARNSSFSYKGRAVDIRNVGRELGVRYVLEGSIRKIGNRVRITGQLIEADTGRHIWADRFDADLADVFDLQDRITQYVVGAIEPNMRIAETERAKTKPTNSLNAYDHYLLALSQSYTWTRAGFEAAQEHIRRAVERDPEYSIAKGTGSRIVMMRKMQSWTSKDDVQLGIRWAREALSDHRDDPITLRSAGQSIALLDRDFDLGLFAVRRAVAISPNSAQVLSGSGWVHAYVGETDTAVEHFHRAMRLSPLDPETTSFLSGLAMTYIIAGDYEAALNYAMRAIPEIPSAVPLRMAAVALGNLGRIDEARAIGRRLIELTPEFRVSQASTPPRDRAACERFLEGLRLAGLPE